MFLYFSFFMMRNLSVDRRMNNSAGFPPLAQYYSSATTYWYTVLYCCCCCCCYCSRSLRRPAELDLKCLLYISREIATNQKFKIKNYILSFFISSNENYFGELMMMKWLWRQRKFGDGR
jgi:hypothetical protein